MKAACAAAALLALATPLALAQELRPGLYQQETRIGTGRAEPSRECVTKKDIDEGLVNIGADKDDGCKPAGVKRGPGRVSYRMVCAEGTTEVQGTYSADSYEWVATASPKGGGGPVRMVTRGKRIGECK